MQQLAATLETNQAAGQVTAPPDTGHSGISMQHVISALLGCTSTNCMLQLSSLLSPTSLNCFIFQVRWSSDRAELVYFAPACAPVSGAYRFQEQCVAACRSVLCWCP